MSAAEWDRETAINVRIMGEDFSAEASGAGWIVFTGVRGEAGLPEAVCHPQPSLMGALDATLEATLRMAGDTCSDHEYKGLVERVRKERKRLREAYDFKHYRRGGTPHGSKR